MRALHALSLGATALSYTPVQSHTFYNDETGVFTTNFDPPLDTIVGGEPVFSIGSLYDQYFVAQQGRRSLLLSQSETPAFHKNSTTTSLAWQVGTDDFFLGDGFSVKLAKLSAQQQLGANLTDDYHQSGTQNFNGSYLAGASLWTKTPLVWQNQQKRTCKVVGEANLSECGEWSDYIYGELPDADKRTEAFLRHDV